MVYRQRKLKRVIHGVHEKEDLIDLLRVCAIQKDLQRGTTLHADILKKGLLKKSPYVASALVYMYPNNGCLEDSRVMFNKMFHPDTITWNTIIDGLAQHGNPKKH